MKKFMMTTAVLAAIGAPAFAQTADNMFRTQADPQEIHASNLIGMRIYRGEGADAAGYAGIQDGWDDIGEVNDIILSRDGEVQSVLVDIGGFLGMGENQVAVDMNALRFVTDDSTTDNDSDYFLVLNTTRESLEQAPAYHRMDQAQSGTSTGSDTDQPDMATGTANSADADVATTEGAADADATGDVSGARVPVVREGYTTADEVDLTAERLTGAAAYDANDEWIGEVSELVLNDSGRVDSVIVDVGGFLGIGEKPVQLNLSDIDILRSGDGGDIRVYISMTKNQMEALPDYRG
ncbi:PRC-barrel domain-containing protein [Frigidibacter sp. SD6-1]|uniref:PRC-barrel domain-containing protein n=1 Tax=Frigidibacter sp. SD6-1 TaxID=3032581 RepID=UPI0024DF6A2F|nr:PRC-barrel domain-containing protein [Frigidibacter sp. SD6-1]